jgi:hypothetical protein
VAAAARVSRLLYTSTVLETGAANLVVPGIGRADDGRIACRLASGAADNAGALGGHHVYGAIVHDNIECVVAFL